MVLGSREWQIDIFQVLLEVQSDLDLERGKENKRQSKISRLVGNTEVLDSIYNETGKFD